MEKPDTGSSDIAAQTPRNGHLLLVDDDLADISLVRELLKETAYFEFKLTTGSSVSEAIDQCESSVDCAIIDYRLPDGDGLELLDTLRSSYPNLPVVMLTGEGDERLTVRAMQQDVDDFIAKAYLDAETLERSIRYAIERKRQSQELAKRSARLSLISELADHAADLLFIVDPESENIIFGNLATRRAMGRTEDDFEAQPTPVQDLFRAGASSWQTIQRLLSDSLVARFETSVWAGTLIGRPVDIHARIVMLDHRSYVVVIARDISDQRRLQSELLRMATYDPITELPRTEGFLKKFQQSVTLAEERTSELGSGLLALYFPDLEGAGLNLAPGSLADWRSRVSMMINKICNAHPDVIVGVGSDTGFWVGIPGCKKNRAFQIAGKLYKELEPLSQQIPSESDPHQIRFPRRKLGMGLLTGHGTQLSQQSVLEMARLLATDSTIGDKPILSHEIKAT